MALFGFLGGKSKDPAMKATRKALDQHRRGRIHSRAQLLEQAKKIRRR
jgi:hypothetical protein